jgi:type I restriction enzyme S subunit
VKPGINRNEVYNLEVSVPPLPEQRRIVSILDKCFAVIDKAKANAEQNLKNAKELFESYLQSVFESGKLKIESGEWKVMKLGEITTILGDGLHGTPKYTVSGDYYFINGNNLNDGKIEIKENTKRVNIDEFKKYKKNLNDRTILVSINGTLGNVAYYNNEKIILGKSACYFNLKENVDKVFIKYLICSSYFIKYAHREATGATIKNVSLKSMRDFLIPFPSLQDQQSIVRQLDALRAKTQKLETAYKKKIANLDELKKSILQEAFSGKPTAEVSK